jgi:hypothetical protein
MSQAWDAESEKMLLLSLLSFEASPDWTTFEKTGLCHMGGRSMAACKIQFSKMKRLALQQRGIEVVVKKRPRYGKTDTAKLTCDSSGIEETRIPEVPRIRERTNWRSWTIREQPRTHIHAIQHSVVSSVQMSSCS